MKYSPIGDIYSKKDVMRVLWWHLDSSEFKDFTSNSQEYLQLAAGLSDLSC